MGWPIWNKMPLISCIIISAISLLKYLQIHLVPTDKQVDKLDMIVGFYFDYYNKLEILWMDFYNSRLDDPEAQERFYGIKEAERTVNNLTNEIINSTKEGNLKKSRF